MTHSEMIQFLCGKASEAQKLAKRWAKVARTLELAGDEESRALALENQRDAERLENDLAEEIGQHLKAWLG
jgi:hypothetical protein